MSPPYGPAMQWITDLVALLGSHGAFANASRSLAEEREAVARLDCFLARFQHPAGQGRTPVEPAVGDRTQVA